MLRSFYKAFIRFLAGASLIALSLALVYVFSQQGLLTFLMTAGLVVLFFGLGAVAAAWTEGR